MQIDMNSVNAAQTVFALFYAITWGALSNVWPRWRAFDWSLLRHKAERPHAWRRCALSVGLLNLIPFIFFVVVFVHLHRWSSQASLWQAWLRLFVCLLQSFVLIGLYWVWVAVVQRFRSTFYPSSLSSHYHPALERDLDQGAAGLNALVALVYVLFPVLALVAASSLCL